MGPRPEAAKTSTTAIKEVNYLPQSKKKRSSHKVSDESGPDEQKDEQPEPESQVQQSEDQPTIGESAPPTDPAESDEPQAQPPEEDEPQAEPQAKPEEPSEPEETEEPVEHPPVDDPEERERLAHEVRAVHNERTGGGPVHEGEVRRQREEHLERVGDASL
jgi:hypothetical protein